MTSYIVRIRAENVPADLAGAPVAVEVFSEAGKAERAALRLSGRPTDVMVSGPGSYLVRTALPSGRIISITVATPETAGPDGLAIGEAVLDMKESDAIADFWREAESLMKIATAIQAGRKPGESMPSWVVDRGRELANRAMENLAELAGNAISRFLARFRAPVDDIGVSSADPASPGVTKSDHHVQEESQAGHPIELTYRWGTFLEWTAGRTNSALVLKKRGDGRVSLNGEIPISSEMPPNSCYYIEIAEPSRRNAALVVWLPGSTGGAVKLGISSELSGYRSGSILSAFPSSPDDAVATTLFEYVRQGAIESARLSLDDLIDRLQNSQETPSANTSILAAYVLYKLRHPYAGELISRLCETNSDLPDAHVLQCAQWIATGRQDSVPDQLIEAIRCGIPIYTEGVRLLRDSSNLCRDLFPDDKRFGSQVRKAHSAASAANFESMLTCLRLGADVVAEFV